MHMIWHHYPGAELPGVADFSAVVECVDEHGRDASVRQPVRAAFCAVKLTVEFGEGFAWVRIVVEDRRWCYRD